MPKAEIQHAKAGLIGGSDITRTRRFIGTAGTRATTIHLGTASQPLKDGSEMTPRRIRGDGLCRRATQMHIGISALGDECESAAQRQARNASRNRSAQIASGWLTERLIDNAPKH